MRHVLSQLHIHSIILYIKDLCFSYTADLDKRYCECPKYAETTVSFELHYEILHNSYKTLLNSVYLYYTPACKVSMNLDKYW